MTSNSNVNFYHEPIHAPAISIHSIASQSAVVSNSMEIMVPARNAGTINGTGLILPANLGLVNTAHGVNSAGASSGLLDNMGLKNDSGLAVDWSIEEQSVLEEGLVRFADEANIVRYIKIAATLRDKTVRDVALRCKWTTKKDNGRRRKVKNYFNVKKLKGQKVLLQEKLVVFPPKTNVHPQASESFMAASSFILHATGRNDHVSYEGSVTRILLDENAQVFSQITANLSTLKMQENINLFLHTRTNIITILKEMETMPGIMSQMPPLPVSVNDELAKCILPNVAEGLMFRPTSGMAAKIIQLKLEE